MPFDLTNIQLSDQQLELTNNLHLKIANTIKVSPVGAIPFSQYMNMALYDSEFGYYNNLLHKFGQRGDFVTSPLVSNLFAKCIVNQCLELFNNGVAANILEIGAGNGQLMLDILADISTRLLGVAPLPTYYILELSASLAKLQQERLYQELPGYAGKVVWLQQLPDNFMGIILANEVLDAQPCEVVSWDYNGQVSRRYVSLNLDKDKLEFIYKDILLPDKDNELFSIAKSLPIVPFTNKYMKDSDAILSNGVMEYVSEINVTNRGFITSLAQVLHQGCILLIDYGYGASEYYASYRNSGTLRGFFRQHLLTDVLEYVGLIDITANVDFSAVANTAIANGLDFIGYTTQASFLLNCGLLDTLSNISGKIDVKGNLEYLHLTNQINKLTSINEMGEIFKVIGFAKNIEFADWVWFKLQDLSHTL